ncbi:hypothetical protein B9J80_00215 [Vibrio sp. V12_P9A6T4]|uniref:hypothetical protein n=1 Tax=Vibrio sp. V12_P9A6T4 TaxID=1938667 RepID=UPI000B8EB2F9|nr:hypothetical protein [Vibrio sp. V12_P9A6T4]OXX57695.1 hypothetical protein B9J80_00215 [Vibrio sp. V12_P9A6T4]
MAQQNLTSKNHKEMDDFLEKVLDGYKNGSLTKSEAINGLAHVMAALDINNTQEAVSWFNQANLEFFKGPARAAS